MYTFFLIVLRRVKKKSGTRYSQGALLYAFRGFYAVGKLFYHALGSFYYDDFKTVVVVKMYVLRRKYYVLKIMLDVGKLV